MKLELIKETKATGEVYHYVMQDDKFLLHTMSSDYATAHGCFEKLKNEHENKIEILETYENN